MKDPATLTAGEILAIAPETPERLFSRSAAEAKGQYRRLAWAWHPDRNASPLARNVFAHVNALYDAAQARSARLAPGLLRCKAGDGSEHVIRYQARHRFELGDMYVGKAAVAFVVERQFADLFENARRTIENFRFADAAMRAELARCLPRIAAQFATRDGLVMIVDKAPDQVLLADLLAHLGGRLDPRHAAWVLSALHNIACYLDHAGLTHNAIGLDTVLVSPEAHSAALLGGWWYAASRGARLAALPARSAALAPRDVVDVARADIRTDLELLRATGRALLGDEGGARLARDAGVPRPLADWLRCAAGGSAFDDYRLWGSVLEASFGARRFVKLAVSASDIYG